MSEVNSPFKFLDPYTIDDQKIFFGRDDEIEKLYEMVFKANLVLVYGASGTGKTSLIQCGLAGKFKSTDWLSVFVRRNYNINKSLEQALRAKAKTEIDENATLPEIVESLFLDFFRPIYLLFDQFEELFIIGDQKEQEKFIDNIVNLLEANLNCTVIIIMREEYLANLNYFETKVKGLFKNRLRVERMDRTNVEQVITGSCKHAKGGEILLDPEEETVEEIIKNIDDGEVGVQLSYLQVYLDKLWREARKEKAKENTTENNTA